MAQQEVWEKEYDEKKADLIKNYEVLINEYSDENLIKNIESIIKIDLSKQIKILCNYFQKQIENINEIDNDENVFIFMHKINFNIIDRDIRRYKKIINSIKKYNERINHKIKKFNLLKEILNSFLVDTGKEIKIDTGEIRVFNIKNKNKINLKNLSSGEKHIILFFCEYLSYFYNLKDGIFIIDEPEISLHINWQELLVKSINEINSNIQLLFATHSPYIIANFTEKMIEIKI